MNNKFDILLFNKNKEINELFITKYNKKSISDNIDKDKIDYSTNKTLSAINNELERKYKSSKKYKNSIQEKI